MREVVIKFLCSLPIRSPEEGEKELEKERDRITPFITFQQVTTTTTQPSTNGGSSGLAALPAPSGGASSTNGILSSNNNNNHHHITQTSTTTTNICVTPKLISSAMSSLLGRGDVKTAAMGMSSVTITSSTLTSSSPSTVEVVELSADDQGNAISSMELLNSVSGKSRVNGDSTAANNADIHLLEEQMLSSISTSSPSLNSHLLSGDDVVLETRAGAEPLLDVIAQDVLRLSPPILNSTSRIVDDNVLMCGTTVGDSQPQQTQQQLPRLKRSLADVDDIVVASSAKRSHAVPSAFIQTYTIHNMSPHNKWTTEKASTIIYNQHNNNG